MIAHVVIAAIAAMRCAGCGEIMGQGERERNPRTAEGKPIHENCQFRLTIDLSKS